MVILTLLSSFWIIFLPPLRAAASDSSRRTWSSLTCDSKLLRIFSTERPWSCSCLSSSARRVASAMACLARSSASLSSLLSSSKSDCIAVTSPSSFLFWLLTVEIWACNSLTRSLASANSFSAAFLARSAWKEENTENNCYFVV